MTWVLNNADGSDVSDILLLWLMRGEVITFGVRDININHDIIIKLHLNLEVQKSVKGK